MNGTTVTSYNVTTIRIDHSQSVSATAAHTTKTAGGNKQWIHAKTVTKTWPTAYAWMAPKTQHMIGSDSETMTTAEMTTDMSEEHKIGTVEWVKSLTDGELEKIRDVVRSLELDNGWYSDENFNLEATVTEYYELVNREKQYRVGVALGIDPAKVNKTVGYTD